MALVVHERQVDPPLRIEDVAAMDAQAAWCMERYRARHASSLLSLNGRQLTCVFEAPDAEAVRSVMRRLDEPIGRLWAATVHAPPHHPADAPLAAGADAVVVVERSFAEPTDVAAIQAIEDRGAWCLDQHRVRFLRTYCAADRRRMLCLYAAPDAEAVRRAQTQAAIPFDCAWAVAVWHPRA